LRHPVILALLLLPAACSGGSESGEPTSSVPTEATPATKAPQTTTAEQEAGAVALVPTPAQALRRCRRFPVLAPACPSRVPEAPFDPASPIYAADSYGGPPGGPDWTFTLGWGGEHPGEPERDRPPALVHVVIWAGDLPRPEPPRRVPVRDGVLDRSRPRPLFLGRETWNGHRGVLLLMPSYPRGGIEGNHLVFRWGEDGTTYRVSVHAWEPFTEVPAVLRDVVESL
jgi:hypothetical protein